MVVGGSHGQKAQHSASLACDNGDDYLPSGGWGSLQSSSWKPWGPANSLFLKNIGERVRHQMQTKNIKRIELCSQQQLILCKLEPHWR